MSKSQTLPLDLQVDADDESSAPERSLYSRKTVSKAAAAAAQPHADADDNAGDLIKAVSITPRDVARLAHNRDVAGDDNQPDDLEQLYKGAAVSPPAAGDSSIVAESASRHLRQIHHEATAATDSSEDVSIGDMPLSHRRTQILVMHSPTKSVSAQPLEVASAQDDEPLIGTEIADAPERTAIPPMARTSPRPLDPPEPTGFRRQSIDFGGLFRFQPMKLNSRKYSPLCNAFAASPTVPTGPNRAGAGAQQAAAQAAQATHQAGSLKAASEPKSAEHSEAQMPDLEYHFVSLKPHQIPAVSAAAVSQPAAAASAAANPAFGTPPAADSAVPPKGPSWATYLYTTPAASVAKPSSEPAGTPSDEHVQEAARPSNNFIRADHAHKVCISNQSLNIQKLAGIHDDSSAHVAYPAMCMKIQKLLQFMAWASTP